MPGREYILSFFRQIRNLPNQPSVDNFEIYAMKCSDFSLFNPASGAYPSVPLNSKKIYCETQISDKSWKRVIVKFNVNDNYDMLWIYPKQNNPQNNPPSGLYFSYPQIIDDFTFTAGPTPTAPTSPNCNVLIGPQTPNCSELQGAIFTWTSPIGVQTVVPANDQRISVNTAQSNNVGTWTLSMTFPNFINSNTNCGSNAYFEATVVVPPCNPLCSNAQILSSSYYKCGDDPAKPIIPNSNNTFCSTWEDQKSVTLFTNNSTNNLWYIDNVPITATGYYPGIGYVQINNSNYLYYDGIGVGTRKFQVKSLEPTCPQISLPTYVEAIAIPYANNHVGHYKPNFSTHISAFPISQSPYNEIYSWNIPGTTISNLNPLTGDADVFFPSNTPLTGVNGTFTISNSPYCNGTYNIYFLYNPNFTDYSKSSVSMYPNPTVSQVTISTSNNALIQSVEIGNLFNPIIKRVAGNNSKTSTINVSTLLPGIYNCKITTNKGVEYQKLIIKR